MAIHSRTIAWKIPWIEEPGRLQPMGLQRVGHDSATSLYFTPWKDSYDQPRQHIKHKDITLLRKVHRVKAMAFPVVMYRCESCIVKKAESQRIDAFKTVELEKILESPLDCKEIKPVNPKGNQS